MADQRSLLFLSKLYHLDNNRDGCVLHWSAARFFMYVFPFIGGIMLKNRVK
jgi:hypothetical protein